MTLSAAATVLLAASLVSAGCSFEHGVSPATHDAPVIADASIDAPPPDARVCPPAPPTCTSFSCPGSSSCYYVCGTSTTGKQSWAGAKGSCANSNVGCLVTINDQAEQDCITEKTMPLYPSSQVWFGWHQDPSGAEPAGGWAWDCGASTYVSPAWGMFEPNNTGGNEDCGLLTNGGGWNDADCTGTGRFVCELP